MGGIEPKVPVKYKQKSQTCEEVFRTCCHSEPVMDRKTHAHSQSWEHFVTGKEYRSLCTWFHKSRGNTTWSQAEDWQSQVAQSSPREGIHPNLGNQNADSPRCEKLPVSDAVNFLLDPYTGLAPHPPPAVGIGCQLPTPALFPVEWPWTDDMCLTEVA